MKKAIKYILLLAAAIITFEVGYYAHQMLSVATAYNAKTLCSCVFVAGRDVDQVMDQDIAVSASAIAGGSVDMEDRSATSSFLFVKSKAIYRPGLGCTLVKGISEETLRAQAADYHAPHIVVSDSLQWPLGNLDTLSVPQDIDLAAVNRAFDYAFDEPESEHPRYTRAALVVYKGKIVAEQYGDGFDQNTPLLGWSMTKSVTNTMVGMRVLDGALDVNAPAHVPSWHQSPNDPRSALTLSDLLHMSSGLQFEENYNKPSDVNRMLWIGGDVSVVPESSKLAHPINDKWSYSSGTTNIISKVIRRSFEDQNEYNRFPFERLFKPLGMSTATIEQDASGTFVGSSFMYASARDWAKWGMLYLNDGIWNGQRLLPEGWVDYSRKRTKADPHGRYSAHFWNNATSEPQDASTRRHWPSVPTDTYYATGYEGQQVVIIPSLDMVVVRLGCTAERSNWDIGHFLSLIVAGVDK